MDQYNLKYIPVEALKNKNIFIEEFFTSADTDVYISGTKCDLISSIQYSLQEQLHPIYGYNSYTYDDVSIGNRIVAGAIKIPISNYSTFMKNFTSTNIEGEKGFNIKDDSVPEEKASIDASKPTWATTSVNLNNNFANIKDIVEGLYNGDEVVSYANIRSSYNLMQPFVSDPGSGGGGTIPEDDDEDTGGGTIPTTPTDSYNRKPKYTRDTSSFFKEDYADSDLKNDIYKGSYKHNYCDILLVVGNSTRKTLKNVIFRSLDNSIESEGDPLYETLQFIARDLIEEDIAQFV